MPGYTAGLQAVQRGLGQRGLAGSGNMLAGLEQYGQQFYNQELQNFAALGGSGVNPVSAGQLYSGAISNNANQNLSGLGMITSGLGGLGQGLASLFSGANNG